jgi:single-stranded-DNA-specific exonuclease
MLNAAGRMGHARLAVELLTSDSDLRSARIAEYLKEQNASRRRRERKIYEQACEMIAAGDLNHPDNKTIVLANEKWHTGVIGIVASRIAEKYCRPTIMINAAARESELAQGSGRSVRQFDLLEAIRACSQHLSGFGGHKMAAGITLDPDKVEQFAADFEAYAKEHLDEEALIDRLDIDALASLDAFRQQTVTEFSKLEPFGQGNPEPMFATKGVRLASPPRKVGARGEHLQITITDGRTAIRCIGFRFGKLEKKLLESDYFNVAYHPQLNHYNGSTTVQFVLADIQFE